VRRARPVLPLVLAGLATAALAVSPAVASADARMSILYDEQDPVRVLTDPSGPGAPLTAERGVFRQDPGAGGIFDPRGRDGAFRIGKVSASEIVYLSPEAMADFIQDEIDDPEHPNSSGLVAIDEVGNSFNDGRAKITYSYVTVRGKKIRVSSMNRIVVTAKGWRVKRGTAPLPKILPESPGARLSAAMSILAARPYPGGGTYAERVHLYIAPAFSTSLAAGRGPHRHLGNDGKPHRATWRGVMPALARAGGVWIEMYHHSRAAGVHSLTAKEWRTVPKAFASYAATFGVDRSRLHMVLSASAAPPATATGCGAPMECQWRLAASTPAGAAILANGPGAYRVGDQATAWRVEYNRYFPGS
jgi:hypothetical protein